MTLEAVRRAQGARRCRPTASISRLSGEFQAIREAIVIAYNLPPIIGLGTGSGFEYQLQNLSGAKRRRYGRRRARPGLRRQPGSGAERRLHHLRGQHAAALPRHRPREGADARRRRCPTSSTRCSPCWAASTSTTSICSAAPGRSTSRARRRPRRIDDIYRINVRNRRARWCRCAPSPSAPRPRAAVDHPLQQLPQRDDQRRSGAGPQLGRGARRHGEDLGDHAAAGLQLRMDRYGAAGEGGGRQDHHHPRARRAVRLPVPGRPLRELDHPDSGAAVGLGRRCRRHDGAAGCPGSTTISTPRSASSC